MSNSSSNKKKIINKYIQYLNNNNLELRNIDAIKFEQHPFHLVKPSPWPFLTALFLFNLVILVVIYLHGLHFATTACLFLKYFSLISKISFSFCVYSWFRDIIVEATYEGRHTKRVQKGLKIGFVLFLISEVMFFFAFFWAFFYSSVSPGVGVGFVWPPLGIKPIGAYGLPLFNTVILISSGISVTWAHKVLIRCKNVGRLIPKNSIVKDWVDNPEIFCFKKVFAFYRLNPYYARKEVSIGLIVTILLGVLFTFIQGYEYCNAQFSINDGIFGSTFYMLTGLHGLHVIIGTLFLLVGLIRHIKYHFQRNHHLGLVFAIWYWHFVDVIWIALYLSVYVWGGF